MCVKLLYVKFVCVKLLYVKFVCVKLLSVKFVCVKFVCVKLLYVKFVCVVLRRRREEEEKPGIQNQKQEPHTKMWGKSSLEKYIAKLVWTVRENEKAGAKCSN